MAHARYASLKLEMLQRTRPSEALFVPARLGMVSMAGSSYTIGVDEKGRDCEKSVKLIVIMSKVETVMRSVRKNGCLNNFDAKRRVDLEHDDNPVLDSAF